MINSSEWVLKAILDRHPSTSRDALEHFLSAEEKSRFKEMPPAEVNTDLEEPHILSRIHWSWFLPIFQSKPLKEQQLFLSALDHGTRENLSRELKIRTFSTHKKSKIVQEFVLQTLTESLIGETIQLLPVYFLPPTPLSPLLHLSKKELIQLIDALSLADLAVELKQIVETKILKKIYSFLSEEEQKFLKRANRMNKTINLATPFYLKKWDGTEKSFRVSLHKRGLSRLGAALSIQHPDFIWYICHGLDVGRGTALLRLASLKTHPNVCQEFVHQIEELLKEFP